MAHLLTLGDFREGYVRLAHYVAERGESVKPRGMPTRELRDVVIELTNPLDCAPVGVNRGLPTKIVAAETIQLIAGVSDLKQLDAVSNGRFKQFSDDGTTLRGAYGPRARVGLASVVERLAEDPDSRQAAVSIWNGSEVHPSRDVPCTMSLVFGRRSRAGRDVLDLSVYMRSNDVWLGTAIDVPVFCQVQAAVAWALGVEVGRYTHHAVSLHVYDRDLESIGRLTDYQPADPIPMLVDGVERLPAPTWVPVDDPRRDVLWAVEAWRWLTTFARFLKEGSADVGTAKLLHAAGPQWFSERLGATGSYTRLGTDRYYR